MTIPAIYELYTKIVFNDLLVEFFIGQSKTNTLVNLHIQDFCGLDKNFSINLPHSF